MFVINCSMHSVYFTVIKLHRQTKPEGFPYQFYSHVMPRDYMAQVSILLLLQVCHLRPLKHFAAMTVVKSSFSQCCITLIILHIFLQAKEHIFPQFKLL